MATQLDMAEQQLYGWHAAQHGEKLDTLVEAMGLKEDEWIRLGNNGSISYLADGEVDEIDNYFANKTKS